MSSQDINAKPGSLKTWLDYLDGIDPDKIELGLDRIKQVLEKLNLTIFKSIPVIEVAGTNGKGSTSALIAAALNYSGIKAGLYTSPHLHKFNERVNIGGRDVTDEELSQAFEIVHKTAGDIKLSYFEYTTLAALVCFSRAKVGAVVLEIGLGGRLDAVNALDADIAVITSIGLDHTKILGDTIGKIAFEKAGIIKLKKGVGQTATKKDVVSNPKHLKIIELEASQLPKQLGEVTAAAINTNFAMGAGLSINENAIFHEPLKNNPYPNVFVVQSGHKNDAVIKKIDKYYHSKQTAAFIKKEFKGSVVLSSSK